MSDTALTLTSVFQKAGTALRIYDLGRRLRRLSADEFERVELLQTPYPSPYLHHAWIALLIANPKVPEQNAVWFLKLPLDEQGFMIPAVRDDLLNRLLSNIEQSVNGMPAEDSLKDNPFYFKPTDARMAVFHARAAQDSGQSASQYYDAFSTFLDQPDLSVGWQNLALQGIADFTMRLQQDDNSAQLEARFCDLPAPLEGQILEFLEHASVNEALTELLADTLNRAITNDSSNPVRIALLIRALSASDDTQRLIASLMAVLDSPFSSDPEVLTAIATRCEAALMDPTLLKKFLETLASPKSGQSLFSRILADLMFLPVHRVLIVQALREPTASTNLKQATDQMFGEGFRRPN